MQYRYLLIPAAKRALKKQRQQCDWMCGIWWGPGRIDPFNRSSSASRVAVDTTIGAPTWCQSGT
jgi:hypothetical protein